MNIYARYFDQDILVKSFDELLDFLSSISEIKITDELVEDLRKYIESDMPYPKRYKVRPRIYFILIKTTAESIEEFKANRKEEICSDDENEKSNKKDLKSSLLTEEVFGWYKGCISFKRVIQIPGTGKFQYQDTIFEAYVKTDSGIGCYNKIIEHLKSRKDVDLRSQFPSAKGSSFKFTYIGEQLPAEQIPAE